MKKRILALLMALVLTVSCLPPVALAEGTQATEANIQSVEQTQPQLPEKVEEETAPALNAAHGAHTCEHCSDSSVEWKAWESGIDLPNTTGHYYLTQPVNLTTLPNGKGLTGASTNVVLCLNGQNITTTSRVYRVSDGAKLTITDCTGKSVIKGGKSIGGVVGVFSDGATGCQVSLYNVKLEGVAGNEPAYGGAISVYHTNMALKLKNVTLSNFTTVGGASDTEKGGAAVYINAAGTSSLTMEGCTVTGCTGKSSANSGAVRVVKAATTSFKDCTFTGNSNTGTGASAIMLASTTATMSGCTVTGNSCAKDNWVGAVYVNPSAPLTLTGKNVIKGNTAKGATNLNLVLNEVSVAQFLSFTDASAASELYVTAERGHADPNGIIKLTAGNPVAFTFENDGKFYAYDKASSTFVLGHKHNDNYADISSAVWQKWDSKNSLPKSGHYYLTEDVDLTAAVSLNTKDGELAICLNGHTITTPDRIFRVSNGFKLTICDCGGKGILKTGASNGGAVGIFKDGTDTATRAATLTMCDVTVEGTEGKTPKQGGAISSTYPGATVKLKGVTFRNLTVNGTGSAATATAGGAAIYMYSTNSDAKLYMDGCTVTGCSDLGTDYTGALKLYKVGTVELKNCSFTNNTSNGNGGSAIVLSTVTNATMSGCTVTGNRNTSSSDWAGAVYLYDSSKLTLSGKNTIEGNTTKNGAASIDLMLQETTKDQQKQFLLFKDVDASSKLNITAKRGTTDPNKMMDASGDTFNITFGGDNYSYDVAQDKFTKDHKHTDGYAGVAASVTWLPWTKTDSLPTSGHYYLTANVTLTTRFAEIKNDDLFLCLNGKTVTARAEGTDGKTNIFRLTGSGSLTICDCGTNAGTLTGASMGAIFTMATATGTVSIYDGIFTGNTTNDSGAVAVMQNTTQLYIYGGQFKNNTATNNGGAIYIGTKATVTVKGGTFTGNTAPKDGGVIVNAGTLNIQGGKFTGNTAGINGGAIHTSGTTNISGSPEITGNTANGQPSNLYLTTGKSLVLGTMATGTAKVGISMALNTLPRTFSNDMGSTDCSAYFFSDNADYEIVNQDNKLHMKAIFNHPHENGYAGVAASVQWQKWTSKTSLPTSGYWVLTENVDLNTRFAEIKNDDLFLCLNGKTITARAEGTDGKTNIFRLTGTGNLTICDCGTNAGKLTGASMGAIFTMATATGTVNIYDGIFEGNTTNDSGAVAVIQNTCQLNIYGGQFKNNTATNNGGAIYIGTKATVTVKGGTFTGNTAPKDGGVIVNTGTLNIQGGKFTGNTAGINGGAIHTSGTTNISGAPEITGNTANGQPSNLYLTTGKSITLGELANGTAKIGISVASNTIPRFISGDMGNQDVSAYFFADAPYQIISAKENKLHLAPDSSHSHCACSGIGGSVCDHDTEAWFAWTETTSLPTSGYWYLTKDVTVASADGITVTDDLHLCLNGHTIDGDSHVILKIRNDKHDVLFTDCLGGGEITNGSAQNYGAIYLEKGSFTMYGGKFSNNRNTQTTEGGWSGGAIHARGQLTLVNVTFEGNTSTTEGGAICLRDGGKAQLEGCTFTGNSAKNGGAIYTNSNNDITITNCAFQNNTASINGGAIYVRNSVITLESGLITENEATSHGGAIYSVGATLNIKDGTVSKNTAGVQGGAIFATECTIDKASQASKINISGGEITKNKAPDGAAIATIRATEVKMTGGSINYNEAANAAGGVLLQTGSKMTVSGEKTYIINNKAAKYAGGVYISTNSSLTMDGGKISGNESGTNGGGIYMLGSTLTINDGHVYGNSSAGGAGIFAKASGETGSTITMNGGNVSTNAATSDGGGISIRDKNTVLNVNSGSIQKNTAPSGAAILAIVQSNVNIHGGLITKNESTASGGAIFMSFSTILTMDGGKITENTAGGNGGGVYLLGSIFDVKGGEIIKNTSAVQGGGIFATYKEVDQNTVYYSKINISGGKIDGNYAPDGGGIGTARYTQIKMTGGHLWGNEANNGAGVLLQTGSEMTISDQGLVAKNIAVKSGGGIYVSSNSSLTMNEGGKITENIAGENGGGVMLLGTTFTMNEGTLYGNQAGCGGGLYAKDSGEVGAKFICKGGNVSTNSAISTSYGGGAVTTYGPNTVFTLDGGYVQKNTAPNGGAVLAMVQSKVEVKSGTMYNNSAERSGGAIYISTDSSMVMEGGKITNNSAKTAGGAIYLLSSELTMKGGSIQYNTTDNYGGGINAEGSVMNLKGGQLVGNTAAKQGGGIYGKYRVQNGKETVTQINLSGTQLTKNRAKDGAGIATIRYTKVKMTGGSISGNVAEMSAGGVLLQTGSSMTLSGGSINSNIAQKGSAGGVYASTRCSFNMYGGTVSNNKAKSAAGGVYLMYAPGNFTGGKIQGNKAGTEAGGIYVRGSKVTLDGTDILDNEAKNGGGISTVRYPNEKEGIDAQPELIIKSGRIAGNKATNGGGMILQSQSETKMLGGSIENNYAKSYGGAIYVSMNHTFNVTGGKITGNESAGWGGGIYHLRGSNGHYENFELSYNKAKSIGGAIIINGTEAQPSAVTMKNVQVIGNEAREGAGVRTQDRFQSFQAEGCTFKDNNATNYAGGLMIFFGLENVIIKNCLFENNSAGTGQGGGVYIMSALVDCQIVGCTFKGNTAGTEGGAMWTQGGLLVKDCTFDDNHAQLEGGAIATDCFANTRVRHPVLYVENCSITNNTSGSNGGGIYADTASYVNVSDTEFTGNSSKAEGGAMWIVDDSALNNITMTGNRSGGEGYALYYHASEYDKLSYIRGAHKIGGEMIIKDNEGGDMYMGEQTGIAVSEKGLTGDTYMTIRLHSGYLTQLLRGAYNYEGGDTIYTVTAGNRSLTDPEVFAEAQESAENDENNNVTLTPAVWVGGGALAIAIIAIALILLILGKKKKAAAGK